MDIAEVCRIALRQNASDIHLKAGLPPMLRLSGELHGLPNIEPLKPDELAKMAWNMMSPIQREKFKVANEIDLAFEVPQLGRFRVNIFRQRQIIGLALRPIPFEIKTVDELRLPQQLKTIAMEPRGMVLVTGITGSGKSTTLAAMVEYINRNLRHHIVTIEDPIEYTFSDRLSIINQREVGLDTREFSTALRAALRQDPDIILVGELRDLETVEIAMSAAESGHLVLSTLHTIDAPETINRLISFYGPEHQGQVRLQLASVLRAIVSQRLIPAREGGRVAAVEIMINTATIQECIVDPRRTNEVSDHMAKGSDQYGSQTFDQSVYSLLQEELIDLDQALRHANNPDDLQLRLSGIASEDWGL